MRAAPRKPRVRVAFLVRARWAAGCREDRRPIRERLARSRRAGSDDATILSLCLSLAAGLVIPLGGRAAMRADVQPRRLEEKLRHGLVAFGAGALVSAVALVPEGAARLPGPAAVAAFLAGGIAFAAIDAAVARIGGSKGQLVAMLTDFVPEAAALCWRPGPPARRCSRRD